MENTTPTKRSRATTRARLPEWLRMGVPSGNALPIFNQTNGAVDGNSLHTVCEEARCPNINDCWGRGTATFMVAGKECTRGCRFCSVETLRTPPPVEADEPERLADAVERMGLKYVVITVVNRDDMADGGATHYRACVDAVHNRLPETGIELLGSDLAGDKRALALLLDEIPLSVFAHNVECVPRLDNEVRDRRASFTQSTEILTESRRLRPDLVTKTSLMVGLGETDEEIHDAMKRLRDEASVDLITFGQYLTPGRPGERFLPVDRYVPPEQFERYADQAYELGFSGVASGPMVRSSFRAGVLLEAARKGVRVETLLEKESATPNDLVSLEAPKQK